MLNMSFLLLRSHFYDNPIQIVGKSAFQHLPELRTLYVVDILKRPSPMYNFIALFLKKQKTSQ